MLSIIGVLLLLQGCKNKNPHQGLPDGMNETKYPNGKIHEQFYIADGKLNGIYMEYDTNGNNIQTTTYKNDKRYGLWDTALSKEYLSQYFFQNDTIVGFREYKIVYTTYFMKDDNFVFVCPQNWHVKEDTIHGRYCVIGKPTKLKRHFIPNVAIVVNKSIGPSVESAIDSGIAEDKQMGMIDVKKGGNIISKRVVLDNDTIIFDSKVIRNNYGDWVMTCAVSDSNYKDYQFLFSTMLNSFTPIKK